MAPVYFQDLLDLYRPCRSLRSGNIQLLKTQWYNLKSYKKTFCKIAFFCNILPVDAVWSW